MQANAPRRMFWQFLVANRGIMFNLVFFAYIIFAQIPLVKAVSRVMDRNQINYPAGILLLAVTIAELVGIHLKLPVLNYRIGKREIKYFGWFFIIWVFHIVVNMSLVLFGLKAVGIFFDTEPLSWIAMALAVFVVLKEIYILMYFWAKPRIKKELPPRSLALREFTGDVLIFIWSAVAFTVTWVYAASSGFIQPGNVISIIAQLIGAMLIFLMMFLPLRLLQFYEDWSLPRTRRQKLFSWLTLAANVVAAMVILYLNSPRW